MKTIVLTTAILLATVIGINKSANAETVKDDTYTVLPQISNINKIEVHGNVELYLSEGNSDQVKVYNNYYKETALVQDQNGTLCISSYKAEKLVVWVTVSDLRNLNVYDNAEVKSFGKLSAIGLEVNLFDSASARLNVDAFQAYITLNDRAKANLAGNINEGTIKYNHTSVLNTANLLSANVIKTDVDNVKDNSTDLVSL